MPDSRDRIKNIIDRFKDLTTIGFANLISTAISGIFWLFMAKFLGTAHYGEVSYFVSIASIAGVIASLGSNNTITVYTAKGEKLLPTIFFITIITGVITSIVLFFLFNHLEVSIFVITYIIFGVAISEILGKKLYKDYSKYIILQKIFFVGFALGFYYLMGPFGIIMGFAFSYLPYSFIIYKGFKESKIELPLLKKHFAFQMNNYALDLSRTFSGNIDKVIVGPMLGFILLGNYQLGTQILSLLSLLPTIVFQYILPNDASGNPERKLKKLLILTSIIFAILGVFLSPIILPIIFPSFKEAITLVQIMSLTVIPLSINLVYISQFLGRGDSKIVFVGSTIFLAVQIIGILVFGKMYSINGVAAALVLATTCETVYLLTIDRITKRS